MSLPTGTHPASVGWLSLLSIVALGMALPGDRLFAEEPVTPALEKPIAAFLRIHCTSCHGGEKPKADLNLGQLASAEAMIKGREVLERVVTMVDGGEMPPQGKLQPTAEQRAEFLQSIAKLFEHADRTARPDPGRVTARRLNRVEYNNTVRDLMGIDFNPAEDFPSDDVGHGFDNIGDVLTLPPVLMERYLAAAEAIVQRAIVVDPPQPSRRYQSARNLEPAGRNVPERRIRSITPKPGDDSTLTGPLYTSYPNLPEGEYQFAVRVSATAEADQPVRIAVLAVGNELRDADPPESAAQIAGEAMRRFPRVKVLESFEVKSRRPAESHPQNNRDRDGRESTRDMDEFEVAFTLPVGLERIAVGLIKPAEGEPIPTLHVGSFSLTGPMDMRPASHRRLLACSADKSQSEQTREVLGRFLPKAYRRPATSQEIERAARVVDEAVADGQRWEAAMQLAMQAVLCSPKFLFRFELDETPEAAEPRPLDEYQLASRLSYFLWSTMPDDELFELVSKGKLTDNLEAQVRRMLRDPKSRALYDNFALQWLQLGRLSSFMPDRELFPDFDPRLRQDMLKETEMFILSMIQEDRSILELIDADFTFVNRRLAEHYGLEGIDFDDGSSGRSFYRRRSRSSVFKRVELDDGRRGGLLTMASILTVTSNPTRTSPVKRGRWVLEQLLGTPPPPPPPDVPELADDKRALSGTLRQQMEQHRANPNCAGCHARMDPLGFAFENYDAIGRYRDKEGDLPIDASGALPDGRSFSGPAELKQVLLDKKELVARCLAEKMLVYALGRGLLYYDKPTVARIAAAVAVDDYKFSRLVIEITHSDPFRLRRGKEPSP